MTMSSPAGPALVLLALATVAVTWGLDDRRVAPLPWPAPEKLRADEVGDLGELQAIAAMEESSPGSGRGPALALVRRLLEERSGTDPEFTVQQGPVPRWGEDTSLELGHGGGHGGFCVEAVRLVRREGRVSAIQVMAETGTGEGPMPLVGARRFPLSEGEIRAMVRVAEALAAFKVEWRAPSASFGATLASWTSTTVRSPQGVLFREAFATEGLGTGDAWQSVRSKIAGELATLLLHGRAGREYRLGSRDQEWLRSIYGRGESGIRGLDECWGAIFAAAGAPGVVRNR